ncbi:MAG: AraC family transcriptional regulator [Cellvibrionaceae bacterium]
MHGIRQRGVPESELLARAGINPDVMNHPRRVHVDQVARLFKQVQLELQDEFMGFTERPCKVGVFATMCELVSHCNTVGELLQKGADFYNLLGDEVVTRLDIRSVPLKERRKEKRKGEGGVKRRGRNAIFSVQLANPAIDEYHFLSEFLLVIWHRFASWYIGEPIPLEETHFAHRAPVHKRELEVMYPGELKFGRRRNRLVFDAAYLEKPLIRTEKELEAYLKNAPADVMTIPGMDDNLELMIERTILQQNPDRLEFPTIEELADLLEVNHQALQRHLKKTGTSYQKIKDSMRLEMAIQKLVNERLSVDEVSELVGFAESRSFTRAFKHWTGLSPRNYCKLQG